MPPSAPLAPRNFLLISACGLTLFLWLASLGLSLKFPQQTTDERAHLSYALQLRDHHFVPPDIQALTLYGDATHLPTATPNYLNHPATAYYPLATLLALLPELPINGLRIFCLSFGIAAYLVYLSIGRRFFSLPGFVLYALFPNLLCFPILLASITTDGIMALGGACVILGWMRWQERQPGWRWLLMFGFLLASGKLNCLLLVAAYSAVYLQEAWRRQRLRELVFPLTACAALAIPYLLFFAAWGSPVPQTAGQLALLQGAAGAPDPMIHSFLRYLTFALASFAQHHVGGARMAWLYSVPLAALLGAMLWYLARLFRAPAPLPIRATCLAWLAVFMLHVLYSYQRYLQYHWPLDFYPRYYLPLLPGFGLVLVQAITDREPGRFKKH
jgi:hypothetical protein